MEYFHAGATLRSASYTLEAPAARRGGGNALKAMPSGIGAIPGGGCAVIPGGHDLHPGEADVSAPRPQVAAGDAAVAPRTPESCGKASSGAAIPLRRRELFRSVAKVVTLAVRGR